MSMYSQRMEEAVASIAEAGAHLKNSVSQGRNQGGGSKGSADPPKCLEGPALATGPALAAEPALT